MTFHTRYLDLLLLLAAIFPSGLGYSLGYVFGIDRVGSGRSSVLGMMILPFVGFGFVLLSLRPDFFTPNLPGFNAVVWGFALLPIVVATEVAIGAVFSMIQLGKIPSGISLPQFWRGPVSVWEHIALLIIAVGEELVYRKFGFYILGDSFGWSLPFVVLTTSALYALNHLYFGFLVVVSKLGSGIVYALSYAYSGSLLVPIIAHVGFNVGLLIVGQFRATRTGA